MPLGLGVWYVDSVANGASGNAGSIESTLASCESLQQGNGISIRAHWVRARHHGGGLDGLICGIAGCTAAVEEVD
jgi:hypothetical protein